MTKLSKEEKREIVLQQAAILFSQNGYSETTILQIAKASGVSFGSIFTYFANKEELFRSAVIEPLNRVKPSFLIEPNESITGLEQIKGMIQEHIKLFSNEGIYLRLIQYVLGQPERFPDLFQELENFLHQTTDSISQVVTKAQNEGDLIEIDPELVALSYFSFINGIRLTILDGPEHGIWEEYIPQALRLFGVKN